MGVTPLRAVFFDRDGVLNRVVFHEGSPGPPRVLQELQMTEGARESLLRLKSAGFALICLTNQPELTRGTLQPDDLAAINAELLRQLPLDDIIVCPHEDRHGCDCRKPKTGLFLQAAERRDIDLLASFMIGDRWRDIEAGARAGCRTILMESEHRDRPPAVPPDATVTSLRQAADWILAHGEATPERPPHASAALGYGL